ncbi:MAG: peptidylprolyl isomerase, partial [Pseudomonadota bacterium]
TVCLFAWALSPAVAASQTIFKPVAIVNDSAITGFDLAQRAQILTVLGIGARSPDQLRSSALDSLIEDRLKLEAGEQVGMSATDEVLKLGLDIYAEQRNSTGEEFKQRMNSQGVSDQALNDLIAADTIWREVVRSRFLARAEPSEARIDEEIALRSGSASLEFYLREIGLRLNGTPEQDQAKQSLILELYQRMNGGGDFERGIEQYSESPSKANQGVLGWVPSTKLPQELVRDLSTLPLMGVTRPVRVQGGVSILQLLERRNLAIDAEETPPEVREQIRQQLLSEELNRLADGYLQELRRDALIELR